MKRRYGAAISAMMIALHFAGPARPQEPDLDQLQTISALLDANDVQALREYLAANPELLEGESDLSRLLVLYMEESQDMMAFLGSDTPRATYDSDRGGTQEALRDALGSDGRDEASLDPDVSIY